MVEATSVRKAVRKARKAMRYEGSRWEGWSVYRIAVVNFPETERYGPFPYNKKWGKK